MREIKFRAISANDEFIYGLPYTDGTNDTVYFKDFNNRMCWRNEKGAHCNQPYKNGTLSEYTGLKDKNGTEVYEGDILKINHKDFKYEVRFENSKFVAYNIDRLNMKWGDLSRFHELDFEIEVIGNIYKNPEQREAVNNG